MKNKSTFEKDATRVSVVSIAGNILLSLAKLFAGLFAHSTAMISDAVHSLSDVFSSVVVIIGVKISSKESDKEHPYGHERLESVAAIILSLTLVITALFIGYNAVGALTSHSYETAQAPGILALVAAVFSIVAKEAMYHYTNHYAKKHDSTALKADAWHHRSDALSSIGSLVGVVGARLGLKWFDPVASIIICLFIIKAAYDIFIDSTNKLVDRSCSEETEKAFCDCALSHDGVLGVKNIQTREFGNKIYVDLEVYADPALPLCESNKIAEEIHEQIEEKFPKVKHIVVVMRPKE